MRGPVACSVGRGQLSAAPYDPTEEQTMGPAEQLFGYPAPLVPDILQFPSTASSALKGTCISSGFL